ncbi:unnamed protein product [Parascedosporium putredinis]|uniref:Zn(2)-C6 fungal-type domain-containing protein n=1 Tax=Parascedosporium putredinis TaxID=1442378 RepID=A0A9P1MEE9_9PEZI|nr:unnamed protein product [Parascedosporium putredinis]CAI8002515.1 unnamed protein product [Parascedosporium putredinis]
MGPPRPANGCWTCKKRKIGCDRGLPSCDNCRRSERDCLGYGVRLSWPESLDGRRRKMTPRAMASTLLRPVRHDKNVITSMISTTRGQNGFCTEILPMALNSRSATSESLCYALLSISAFHQFGRDAAFPYKLKALKYLSKCLTVRKEIAWFIYYDVLAEFTQSIKPHWHEEATHSVMQSFEMDTSVIVGSLGCSIELFGIIREINQLRDRYMGRGGGTADQEMTRSRTSLESKLLGLIQRVGPEEDGYAVSARWSRVITTAELYRLAACLYLQRACPTQSDDGRRQHYLVEAFRALHLLQTATSPWPVFVIACEVQSEEQRIVLLNMLDKMESVRNIGNIRVMRGIIEMYWKQMDLRGSRDSQLGWWNMVQSPTPVPWFV